MTATTTAPPRTLRLNAADNVRVAIDTIMPGTFVEGIAAIQRIPKGHKMAITGIAEGAPVLKFGQIIGFAKQPIGPGEHIHEHNCGMHDFDRDYQFAEGAHDDGMLAESERRTFEGYKRPNGKVGTRNYIGVLTSVNCSATVARHIAEAFNRSGLLDAFPNVDGVVPFVHGTGCGMGGSGEGYETLERTQWGYASHPNLAGVLVVGLGCEVFQIPRLMKSYNLVEHDGFRTMTIQETGGTRRTIERGVDMIREMLPAANGFTRSTQPVADIMVLVRHGGTTILSETPEIYGAEHLLTRRAANREVGEKLVDLIHWWEDYTVRNQGEMNNNPSPGNKAGGLTTILEKSLGAAAKGGTATLRGVYKYAEPIDAHGFVYMDSPGYDPAAVTGQIASGANMIVFTTGRGSAAGYKPTPSIKLATNSDLYARMTEDMDINCGDILDGVSIEKKGEEIFEEIIAVASGKRSKSEELGYGDAEFVPWQIGAVM